ncbi:hypothetical protein N0V82_006134 [Gnomoniopsis sp. IMI 355080]|nr:hypothetical protein N0V82_006134 [Gnomoniopsis sp. IMI 355080]
MAAIMSSSVQPPQATNPMAKYTPAPGAKSLDDYGLLIYDRYTNIFEPLDPESLPEDCVRLGPDDVLFLIEAPLNAVELYEAILKPRTPLKVHSARLVPRSIRKGDDASRRGLADEYLNGQGKLAGSGNGANAVDREVHFIVIPRDTIWQLQMYDHFMWPVQLQYMSIPVRVSGAKTVRSPYAVICYHGHRVYQKKLRSLLKETHLANDPLSRSLLPVGTIPLPETLKDYVEGLPGKDVAAPYFMRPQNAQVERPTILRRVTSNLPTVRRAVSNISLRRSRSAMSVGDQQ